MSDSTPQPKEKTRRPGQVLAASSDLISQEVVLKCEIAPGVEGSKPVFSVPRFAILEYGMDGKGVMHPRRVYKNEWIDVHRHIDCLPMDTSARTLIRLGHNGYVRLRRVSPNKTEVQLKSLLAHFDAVEADLYFWTRKSIPAGWDEKGRVVWEDCLMTRLQMWQSNDIYVRDTTRR